MLSAEPPGRLAERTAERVTSCDDEDSLDAVPRRIAVVRSRPAIRRPEFWAGAWRT